MSALPVRSFMDGANTKWRHGYQPNYDVVNEKFMAEKTMNHKDGSLEQVVENLVKTWEMESSHKMDAAVCIVKIKSIKNRFQKKKNDIIEFVFK